MVMKVSSAWGSILGQGVKLVLPQAKFSVGGCSAFVKFGASKRVLDLGSENQQPRQQVLLYP